MSKTIVEADSKIYMEIQMARIIKVITLKKNKIVVYAIGCAVWNKQISGI